MSNLGNTPVWVAVNNMTGAWEEFCLTETPEYAEWRAKVASYGWRLEEHTLDEVFQHLDDSDATPIDATVN